MSAEESRRTRGPLVPPDLWQVRIPTAATIRERFEQHLRRAAPYLDVGQPVHQEVLEFDFDQLFERHMALHAELGFLYLHLSQIVGSLDQVLPLHGVVAVISFNAARWSQRNTIPVMLTIPRAVMFKSSAVVLQHPDGHQQMLKDQYGLHELYGLYSPFS